MTLIFGQNEKRIILSYHNKSTRVMNFFQGELYYKIISDHVGPSPQHRKRCSALSPIFDLDNYFTICNYLRYGDHW